MKQIKYRVQNYSPSVQSNFTGRYFCMLNMIFSLISFLYHVGSSTSTSVAHSYLPAYMTLCLELWLVFKDGGIIHSNQFANVAF